MDQQTWIITLHNDSAVETDQQIKELRELLLDASPSIEVTVSRSISDTQSGGGDILTALLQSSAMIAAINAIKLFFLRNHQNTASIEIEIKGAKFKAVNLSSANYKHTLDELLKYAQTLDKEEK